MAITSNNNGAISEPIVGGWTEGEKAKVLWSIIDQNAINWTTTYMPPGRTLNAVQKMLKRERLKVAHEIEAYEAAHPGSETAGAPTTPRKKATPRKRASTNGKGATASNGANGVDTGGVDVNVNGNGSPTKTKRARAPSHTMTAALSLAQVQGGGNEEDGEAQRPVKKMKMESGLMQGPVVVQAVRNPFADDCDDGTDF